MSSCRHIRLRTGAQIHVQHTLTRSLKKLPSDCITLICQRATSAFHWGFLLSSQPISFSMQLLLLQSPSPPPPQLTFLPSLLKCAPPLFIKPSYFSPFQRLVLLQRSQRRHESALLCSPSYSCRLLMHKIIFSICNTAYTFILRTE